MFVKDFVCIYLYIYICELARRRRRRRGYLTFPSLGGPHAGEKIKKHPLGGSQGGGNRGPGRPGLRMAAKLFEITCTNVKK